MNSARLLRLALHLENNVERKDFVFSDNEKCAMGHACRIPYFKKLGLKYKNGEIVLKGESHHCAASKLFDISRHDALALFVVRRPNTVHKNYHPTPKQVAKAIQKYVKANIGESDAK